MGSKPTYLSGSWGSQGLSSDCRLQFYAPKKSPAQILTPAGPEARRLSSHATFPVSSLSFSLCLSPSMSIYSRFPTLSCEFSEGKGVSQEVFK